MTMPRSITYNWLFLLVIEEAGNTLMHTNRAYLDGYTLACTENELSKIRSAQPVLVR